MLKKKTFYELKVKQGAQNVSRVTYCEVSVACSKWVILWNLWDMFTGYKNVRVGKYVS